MTTNNHRGNLDERPLQRAWDPDPRPTGPPPAAPARPGPQPALPPWAQPGTIPAPPHPHDQPAPHEHSPRPPGGPSGPGPDAVPGAATAAPPEFTPCGTPGPGPELIATDAPGPHRLEQPAPAGPRHSELTYDLIVRRRGDRPTSGWRAALYTLTRGACNPGPSQAENTQRRLLRRITAPLSGWHTVTVASMKGGVGKTTVAALLGLTLAEHRGDRVVALDANPDAGTLAARLLGQPATITLRDLINNLDTIGSLTDITRYTLLARRLQILASEQDPAKSESFNRDEFDAVVNLVRRFFNIIITDSGTGLTHSAMAGALATTRSLVIVGAPTVDAAELASRTLDWLAARGFADLVADAVVALSFDRFSRDVDRCAVVGHFEARCRVVVPIPADPHLITGGHIQLDHLQPRTLDAALALAAAVADNFTRNPQPALTRAPLTRAPLTQAPLNETRS